MNEWQVNIPAWLVDAVRERSEDVAQRISLRVAGTALRVDNDLLSMIQDRSRMGDRFGRICTTISEFAEPVRPETLRRGSE